MRFVLTFGILVFLLGPLKAQDRYDYDYEEAKDTLKFLIGLNVNAYFANHNTAILYSGQPAVTPFGIENILEQPQNRQTFDNYFNGPYRVVEYPLESRYRTNVELGLHFQYLVSKEFGVYVDFNVTQLDYEQFFTIQVDDPTNNMPGPTLLKFPIIGQENRFNLNIGAQVNFYQGLASEAYLAVFGNLNNVRVQTNYMVINDVQYDIFHNNINSPNLQPGGNGYGGGLGLGYRFDVSEYFAADINYQLIYTQINVSEIVSEIVDERSLQNAIGIRAMWRF